jgi:tetratricopeptide (TPR) repeat protein
MNDRMQKTMTTQSQIRCKKIQREAEGYLELGMPQQALHALERLGDPAKYDAESLYLWGEVLRAMEQYADALKPLKRAAKAAPNDVRVRIAMGWCYKRTGRLDLAIDALEQALLVEPDLALLRYNLACYLSLAGQKRRSLRYLAQALTLDPTFRDLVETETDFDPLRGDPDFESLCNEVSH